MNIENCIVIVDEVQNLTRMEARVLLSRMGEGVRCFLTGDRCVSPIKKIKNIFFPQVDYRL